MRDRKRRGPWARLALMVSAVGLFVIGYYWGNQYQYRGQPPVINGVLIAPAMPLPGFELEDAAGRAFGDEDLTGHWTLLAFAEVSSARGQLAIARMIDVSNRLAEHRELQSQLQLVLAATRQSANLARDFQRLSGGLRVLSGTEAELERLARVLGETPDGRGDRDAALYLLAPEGSLTALFAASQSPETIASDLISLSELPLDVIAPHIDP